MNEMDREQEKPLPRTTLEAIMKEIYEPIIRQHFTSFSGFIAAMDKRTDEQKKAAQLEYAKWCHATIDFGDFEFECDLPVNHSKKHKRKGDWPVPYTIAWSRE